LLNTAEMANASVADVIAKLQSASYANQFKSVFGVDIFNNPSAAFDRMAYALERYQIEDADFAPFSSKFDAVNAGKASFTEEEIKGLAWFNRADKGNCAACHPSTKPSNAPAALFTDFTYDNLGLPRNSNIAANANVNFFDKGLCGPVRLDMSARTDLCGAFKVPACAMWPCAKGFFTTVNLALCKTW